VAEEAFFRGALQPHVGLVAASLIFGLAHFAPRRDLLPWTAFSLGAGLLLGGLFEMTGNLLAPVAAHALINAVNLRFLSLYYAPSA
jgi:membrane protease YdiL (CAAX protease family)